MRKVTDLKDSECIHCPTQEEFDKIITLNPKNTCKSRDWRGVHYYYPFDEDGAGQVSDLAYVEENNITIYKASEFLQPFFEHLEEIEVSDYEDFRIIDIAKFIGYNSKNMIVVEYKDNLLFFNFARKKNKNREVLIKTIKELMEHNNITKEEL